MVHKQHTFTLIIGAVFGVLLALAIAFLTFFGLTQLPFFANNSNADEKTEAFLATIVGSMTETVIEDADTNDSNVPAPTGVALDTDYEEVRISELRGTVVTADVRGFEMEAVVPGAKQAQTIRVDYAASTLLSTVSSDIQKPGVVETSEYVIGPTQILPEDAVVIYTTGEITKNTEALVARQVKQIQ